MVSPFFRAVTASVQVGAVWELLGSVALGADVLGAVNGVGELLRLELGPFSYWLPGTWLSPNNNIAQNMKYLPKV